MYPLLRLYLDICLLKAGPQDLPPSRVLLGVVLGAYIGVGALVLPPEMGPGAAVWQAGVDTAFLVVFTLVLLSLTGKPERINQTLAALAGSGVFFSLVAWPALAWLYRIDQDAGAPVPLLLILVAIMVWSLVVMGHILHHALSVRFGLGMLAAIGYIVLSLLFTQLVGLEVQ